MKLAFKFTLCILMIISLDTHSQECSYFKDYPKECNAALVLYQSNFHQLNKLNKYSGLSNEFLWSIVAPEITQYSSLRNKFETYSLKVLYVQYGKGYADFSIGYFQMKPSFIEQLESYIASNSQYIHSYKNYLFKNPNSKEARITRINRLEDLNWQLKYLIVFGKIMNDIFPEIHDYDISKKLRFYSTAYNSGFLNKREEIIQNESRHLFPHYTLKKYNYSVISTCFYEKLTSEIINFK